MKIKKYCMLFSLLASTTLMLSCKEFIIQNNLDQVYVKISEANAINCVQSCSGVRLKLILENKTNSTICFSSRYTMDGISKSLYLTSIDNKILYDQFQTIFDVSEEQPDLPNNQNEHVKVLRSEPNIIVLPQSNLSYTVYTGDKFNIPRLPMKAHLAMFVYFCDQIQSKKPKYIRYTPEALLGFDTLS